ncbi:MAG: hypothetical protein HY340_01270 [Candidatus Kerfeldbacteria bacterium]|nr:hypothetical protein [Candidatus Kerfeldbacteria bacterium]
MIIKSMRIVMALLAAMALSGCGKQIVQETSAELHEDAIIANAVHTPSDHRVGLGMTAFDLDDNIGFDMSGNMGLKLGGGLQVSSSTVPEKFAVVFRCPHGEFIIERREIYERLHNCTGHTADISYREVYRTTKERRDGEWTVSDRVLVDFDFLNAVLKTPVTPEAELAPGISSKP